MNIELERGVVCEGEGGVGCQKVGLERGGLCG